MLVEDGGQGGSGTSSYGRIGGIGVGGEGSSPGRHGGREGGNWGWGERYGCHESMVDYVNIALGWLGATVWRMDRGCAQKTLGASRGCKATSLIDEAPMVLCMWWQTVVIVAGRRQSNWQLARVLYLSRREAPTRGGGADTNHTSGLTKGRDKKNDSLCLWRCGGEA